jgi:hypothetical protein
MNGEEEYFQYIEEYFLQKRGNPMLLSPKEWSLIREWYEANIPQEVVIRAIDRAFESKEEEDRQCLSLRYCRRLVKSEYKRHLKSLEGQQSGSAELPETKNINEFLSHLVSSLTASAMISRDSGNISLGDFLEKSAARLSSEIYLPFQESQVNDLQRVEHQLSTIEKEIEQLLLQTISNDLMDRLKEESMRDLKMFENKLELPVYQEMLRRSLIKSVRKLYNIPRLSLFYM